jgi:hypothetical protein
LGRDTDHRALEHGLGTGSRSTGSRSTGNRSTGNRSGSLRSGRCRRSGRGRRSCGAERRWSDANHRALEGRAARLRCTRLRCSARRSCWGARCRCTRCRCTRRWRARGCSRGTRCRRAAGLHAGERGVTHHHRALELGGSLFLGQLKTALTAALGCLFVLRPAVRAKHDNSSRLGPRNAHAWPRRSLHARHPFKQAPKSNHGGELSARARGSRVSVDGPSDRWTDPRACAPRGVRNAKNCKHSKAAKRDTCALDTSSGASLRFASPAARVGGWPAF